MPVARFHGLLLVLTLLSGCASSRPMIVSNPVFVPANSQHAAWERAVDVLHDFHFPIARENRLDGVIETDYRVGSNVLEPWHGDSVDMANRLESTLQSLRRKVKVDLTPVEGGYLVGVEAFKEQEDLAGVAENTVGAATFRKNAPLERNLTTVVGQSAPVRLVSARPRRGSRTSDPEPDASLGDVADVSRVGRIRDTSARTHAAFAFANGNTTSS